MIPEFKNGLQQEERRVLDDIVPAIEGVMTALPQPVERPRNPEVKIRLSSNTIVMLDLELGSVLWAVFL